MKSNKGLLIIVAVIIAIGLVTLVFKKDNPSALSENNTPVTSPITPEQNIEQKMMSIELYYYNPSIDQGPGGVQCSKNGLVKVNRTIPQTTTPLTESIKLLLRGEISPAEKMQGITSEFPLAGVSLVSASIQDSVATLTFSDPQSKTVGGSCRVAILWAQIQATAKQFSTVTSVRFMPEELFQP
jgi:spore germination protein GerM